METTILYIIGYILGLYWSCLDAKGHRSSEFQYREFWVMCPGCRGPEDLGSGVLSPKPLKL